MRSLPRSCLLLIAALTLLGPSHVSAQSADDLADLRREVEALKESQLRIQRELQDINAMLRRGQPVTDVQHVISIDGYPAKGAPAARVVIVEFTDFQCPFCARYVQQTWPQIEREYVSTGRLRYVVRDFPIESIHKDALKAAEAARCAGDQGRYWDMYHRLFSHQTALTPNDLPRHAEALSLDVHGFRECLDDDRYAAAIRQDLKAAQVLGIRATPTFFVGTVDTDGSRMKVVKLIAGAHPYAVFKQVIDALLSAGNPDTSTRGR